MATSTSKKFEVILNAQAMGLTEGDSQREVTAASYKFEPSQGGHAFYDADGKQIAFFQHVMGILPA